MTNLMFENHELNEKVSVEYDDESLTIIKNVNGKMTETVKTIDDFASQWEFINYIDDVVSVLFDTHDLV